MKIVKEQLYCGGKRQKATSGKTFLNINPSTNKVINEIESASQEDLEKDIESAKKGFAVWSKCREPNAEGSSKKQLICFGSETTNW